ncbi:MAG: CoA transferase [Alphaproteobacteria bacterium]|nr:CoA transferase [Alphaproteobacteria bacterium]MCB9930057.1 CoA transferase [Alphaproteobacteria bacterium]
MLPLKGVRILAVEQYGAGPFGTMHLADLGAEIVKIENAGEGGDVGRHVRHPNDPLPKGDSLFFQAFNRNKRSITLNLKSAEGQAIFRQLAAGADAVFNNLRGDLPGKLGLTYDQLKDVNAKLVCVHLSAYGRTGERAAWPGYDYLMQAECGYLSVTGEPGGPPSRMGLSLVDLSTGLQAAIALASGIIGARASGQGGDYDVSLFDAAMANVAYVAAWYLTMGEKVTREPRSAHPNLTPSQLYKTQDGWIFIMCNKEKFWPALCNAIGQPSWAEIYPDFATRLTHRDRLTELLDEALSARTTAEWMAVFGGAVPAAPVNDIGQALDNPFAQATGQLIRYTAPDGTPVGSTGSAIRVPGQAPLARPAPPLAADQAQVLAELGLSEDEIERLRAAGAF